jgi:sec-independent protein translocase protein TatA
MFGFEKIGMPEIIVVAVVLLIIFGPKKLPELAKGISQAAKELMSAFSGEKKKESKK